MDKSMLLSLTAVERSGKPEKLLDRVRDVLRFEHYSLRSKRIYYDWITCFLRSTANAIRARWAQRRRLERFRKNETKEGGKGVFTAASQSASNFLMGSGLPPDRPRQLGSRSYLPINILRDDVGSLG
jgi:hypothetical protein